MDNELIVRLAQARARLNEAKSAREALLAAVTDSADYKLQLEFITQAQADIETATAAIKDEALGAWTATGSKKPHPAIGIKVMTKLVYGYTEATDWAKDNAPAMLTLDAKLFEAFAKTAAAKKQPLSFVGYNEVPTVTIASDLSEYMTDPLARLE